MLEGGCLKLSVVRAWRSSPALGKSGERNVEKCARVITHNLCTINQYLSNLLQNQPIISLKIQVEELFTALRDKVGQTLAYSER